MNYQMIEDNGGGLYLFVDDGEHKIGFRDFEYLSHEDVEANLTALEDPATTAQVVRGWDGQVADGTDAYVRLNLDDTAQLIALYDGEDRILFADRMGRAGLHAFGITK